MLSFIYEITNNQLFQKCPDKSVNASILKSKCEDSSKGGSDSGKNDNMKWILAALALGGLGGLAYLLMSGSEKKEKCKETKEDPKLPPKGESCDKQFRF